MPERPKPTPWIYFRSALQWAIALPNMLLHMSLAFLVAAMAPRYLEPILRSFARSMCAIAGLKIRTHGVIENTPPHACIVIFNHTNIFDLFSSYVYLPFRARGIEKESHFRWPIYGSFLKMLGQVPIAPAGNTRKALQSLEEAKKLFHRGISVAIAPEGTRSPDGQVAAFKKGAFHMAIQLQADILPVVLKGMYEFNQKGSFLFYPRTIDVYFEPVIHTKGLGPKDVTTLRDHARQVILKRFSTDS